MDAAIANSHSLQNTVTEQLQNYMHLKEKSSKNTASEQTGYIIPLVPSSDTNYTKV
jgi:hypothetical protein